MSLTNKVKTLYDKIPSKKKLLEKGGHAAIATLKATKIKKEDSIWKKASYSLLNFIGHYQVMGCLPGTIQKELVKPAGLPKTLLTWESIGFGVLLGVLKYASGDAVAQTDMTLGGYLLQGWGMFRLAEAAIRTTYTAITKEPLGLLVIELVYKLAPSKYEFKEKSTDLEKALYENIERLNTEWISDYYEN